MTSELYIQQLFRRPESDKYILDRVMEVITFHLESEREKYIQELETRNCAFDQALYKVSKPIESIWHKILELSSRKLGPIGDQQVTELRNQVLSLFRPENCDEMKDAIISLKM
jgi:hypothetical protein